MSDEYFITRKEMLADSSRRHHAYYRQFVEGWMIDRLLERFGAEQLLSWWRGDMTIPVEDWDRLYTKPRRSSVGNGMLYRYGEFSNFIIEPTTPSLRRKLKRAGEMISPCFYVCVFKEAARLYCERLCHA